MSIEVSREGTTVYDFRPWSLLKRLRLAWRIIYKPHFEITHVTTIVPLDSRAEMVSKCGS